MMAVMHAREVMQGAEVMSVIPAVQVLLLRQATQLMSVMHAAEVMCVV